MLLPPSPPFQSPPVCVAPYPFRAAFMPPGLVDPMIFLHACSHTLIVALVPLVHLHVLTVLLPLFAFFWTLKTLGAGTLVYCSNGLHDILCLLKLS